HQQRDGLYFRSGCEVSKLPARDSGKNSYRTRLAPALFLENIEERSEVYAVLINVLMRGLTACINISAHVPCSILCIRRCLGWWLGIFVFRVSGGNLPSYSATSYTETRPLNPKNWRNGLDHDFYRSVRDIRRRFR